MKNLSKNFYFFSYLCGSGLGYGLIFIGDIIAKGRSADVADYFYTASWVPIFYSIITTCVLFYKAWGAIQGEGERTRTTPGRAIGFLFIPVFNYFWVFRAFGGFAEDFNWYRARHNISADRLNHEIFQVGAVFSPFGPGSALISFPEFKIWILILQFVIWLLIVNMVCDAVNAIKASIDSGEYVTWGDSS